MRRDLLACASFLLETPQSHRQGEPRGLAGFRDGGGDVGGAGPESCELNPKP